MHFFKFRSSFKCTCSCKNRYCLLEKNLAASHEIFNIRTSVIYSPSAIGSDSEDEELRTEIAAAICVFALGFFSVPATNVLVSAFSFAKSLFMLNIHFLGKLCSLLCTLIISSLANT